MRYEHLFLLGKTVRFTVDVSGGVGCGCNAALYLVAMEEPDGSGSQYCDILGGSPRPCVEIDLFEGNTKALATTLHTDTGFESDTCNEWGCQTILGGKSEANCKFGSGSLNIDSSRPFELAARFELDGEMTVDVGQDGVWRRTWDRDLAMVPAGVFQKLKRTLASTGVVLVMSQWAAEDMSWLDGGCNAAYPHCDLDRATTVFADLKIEENAPTAAPTGAPTFAPSAAPVAPTGAPAAAPTAAPLGVPTGSSMAAAPTAAPAAAPTASPTASPPSSLSSRTDAGAAVTPDGVFSPSAVPETAPIEQGVIELASRRRSASAPLRLVSACLLLVLASYIVIMVVKSRDPKACRSHPQAEPQAQLADCRCR